MIRSMSAAAANSTVAETNASWLAVRSTAEAACSICRSDQLGLPRLLGQPPDGVRGGLGSGLPSRGGLPLLRQLAQLDGQRGMDLHPVVDLGDRRGTPLDLLVGGFQRLDRGNPLAGGAAGRGEVATVFAVDALDQQRLGTRQRGGVTRGQ